jgi:uncharacterized membrane protein
MNLLHNANLFIHLASGALATVFGVVCLAGTKGGRWHRRAGRIVVPLAVLVAATAVVGILLSLSRTALVAVTLSASYQLAGSLRALALKERKPSSPDVFLALLALCAALLIGTFMGSDNASFTPVIGYSALAFVSMVALYDLGRHRWSLERWRQIRPLDHGLKMTGFFFAMISAGAGNLLRGAQPWSGVVPSVVGTVLMAWFAIRYYPARGSALSDAPVVGPPARPLPTDPGA